MPYRIVKVHGGYAVKGPDGHVYGTHKSKAKAQAQVRAIYANEKKGH